MSATPDASLDASPDASPSATPDASPAVTPDASSVASPAPHPPLPEMVQAAIKNLNQRNGSSLSAIKKYINANYNADARKLAPFLRRYLQKRVAKRKLIQVTGSGANGSFRLRKPGEKVKKPGKPVKKEKKRDPNREYTIFPKKKKPVPKKKKPAAKK